MSASLDEFTRQSRSLLPWNQHTARTRGKVVAAICLTAGLVLMTADILKRELRLDRTRSSRFVREREPEPEVRVLSGAARPG